MLPAGAGAVPVCAIATEPKSMANAANEAVAKLLRIIGDKLRAGGPPAPTWSNEALMRWALAALAMLLTAGVTPAQPTGTQQIFDESFRRLQSYPVPPFAVWTTTWHIRERPMGYYTGESSSVEVYRYAVRLSDGMENVSEPPANGKLPPATIEPEFLGPFAWTMRSTVHVAPASTGEVMMQPDIAGLKTIASVVAVAKPSYRFGGDSQASPPVEDVGGRAAYHLQLRPVEEPRKHNLRDLWIDVETHDLLKAHFVGTYRPFPQAPVSPSDITAYFRSVLGCWVVTRAVWTYDNPPISYLFDVQNDEIGLPATLPDWLFDSAAYQRHQAAGELDYLGLLLEQMRKDAAPPPQ
jgi:hypothetical protein